MTIRPPKSFGIENVKSFLKEIEVIFTLEHKAIPDLVFDLRKVSSISLIGQLLIYKFVSYTAENDCFQSPTIRGRDDPWLDNKFKEYGFYDIIMAYVNNPKNKEKILNSYKKLELKEFDRDRTRVLIAPQKLLRVEERKRNELEQRLFRELFEFYGKNAASILATTCIGELLSNFWSHATSESGTVMVAMGNKYYIEICIADNAMGICSSLKQARGEYQKKQDIELLNMALEKGVTSKPNTNHMGLGLFLIREISKANRGHLAIYSEGYYYEQKIETKSSGKCGYWKGSIVYLRLDLTKPVAMENIPSLMPSSNLAIIWR